MTARRKAANRDEGAIGNAGGVDAAEVERFNRLASDWWDPNGRMKPLHRFNPVRLTYLRDCLVRHFRLDANALRPLGGLSIIDIGCGGGLLSEPLARMGATVAGIDPAVANIEAAKAHAAAGGLSIDYRAVTVESMLAEAGSFDVVLAMEVVEHVPDVSSFVAACGKLVKPGGLMVAATLNRTLRSFALGIVGAEYVLRWLPVGTHSWDKFVTPAELRRAMTKGDLAVTESHGVVFNPLTAVWSLSDDHAVNYVMAATRR
jgi:2-polyprenyl-6-hydroxyphenyl methylase / 3-demethylubiquinone-9 3-methyltransferase